MKIFKTLEDNKVIYKTDNDTLYSGYSSTTGLQDWKMINSKLGVKGSYYNLGNREKSIVDRLTSVEESKDFYNCFVYKAIESDVYNQNDVFVIRRDGTVIN